MLDHVGLKVSSFDSARAFYQAALAPLGLRPLMDVTAEMTGNGSVHAGFGDTKPFFWIGTGGPVSAGVHVAFEAASRAVVDAFHKAACAAGGHDNGAPGERPHYHQHYYAAFVLDADGNNIEAVCHAP